ncbi:MAG: hypothetical protein P8I91_09870 [Phycisphaerales bacterium]|nr:hypothetical protein [Phycisphaerales bacterium]
MLMLLFTCLACSIATPNAAAVYTELTDLSSAASISRSQSDDDTLNWIALCIERGAPLDDRLLAFFYDSQQEMLALTRRAADIEHCDFELPLKEEGFDVLLPHLSGMMAGARVLVDAAYADQVGGSPELMVGHVETLLQMGRHLVSSDQTIIASMVSIRLARMAESVVQSAMDRGEIDPAMAAPLARAMNFTATPDPFGLRAGLAMERVVGTEWFPRTIGLNNSDLDPEKPLPSKEIRRVQEMFAMVESVSNNSNQIPGWNSPTVGELRAAVDQLDSVFARMLAAMDDPNVTRRLKTLESISTQVDMGEHGMLASLFVPGLPPAVEQQDTALADFARCQAQLQSIADGEPVAHFANAGDLWMRAGRLAEPFGGIWIDSPDDAVAIDALLSQSRHAKRRVYPSPWEDYLEATITWWLPGQVALLDGLMRRIDVAISSGNASQAVADMEVALLMIAALCEDPRIATSLAAVDALGRIAPLVQRFAATPAADEAARRTLIQLIRAVPTRDPAGLQRAALATRDRLQDHLSGWYKHTNAAAPAEDEALLSCIAWLRGWASAHTPPLHVVPSGATINIQSLDTDTTRAWYELGVDSSPPLGFPDLPATTIAAAATTHADTIQRMRAALQHGQ